MVGSFGKIWQLQLWGEGGALRKHSQNSQNKVEEALINSRKTETSSFIEQITSS